MAHGYLLEAEYENGFVLTEDERDHSPFDAGRNFYHAIVNGRPTELGHGKLVRFSLIAPHQRFDIDWTKLPEDAKPVYYRKMETTFRVHDGHSRTTCNSHHFGWEGTLGGEHVEKTHTITD